MDTRRLEICICSTVFPDEYFISAFASLFYPSQSREVKKGERRNSCEKRTRKFLRRAIFTARLFGLGASAIIGWTIFIKSDFMLSYIALDGGPVGVPCIWLDRHTCSYSVGSYSYSVGSYSYSVSSYSYSVDTYSCTWFTQTQICFQLQKS